MSLADVFSAVWNFPLIWVVYAFGAFAAGLFLILWVAEMVNRWRDRQEAGNGPGL